MSWLNRRLIVTFVVLSLACISEASATSNEEDLLVKMPHLPSKSIRWGMSVDELKKAVKIVACENDGSGISCDYVGQDLLTVTFFFEKDLMTGISSMSIMPKSNPGKLDKEIAELQNVTGNNPQRHKNEGGAFYKTELEFSSCKSSIKNVNETMDVFYTFCTPGTYIYAYINPPAKESFKLLDLTLGKSTQEDIIAASKANNWEYLIVPVKGKTIIELYGKGIQIEGVAGIELNLIDNKLESVQYGIDKNFRDRGSFYKLLTSKYGKHVKNEKTYYVWEVNPATRDNVSIIMSFDGEPENVTSISYSLRWLAQKGLETTFAGFRKESDKTQDLKSKAF